MFLIRHISLTTRITTIFPKPYENGVNITAKRVKPLKLKLYNQ